MRLSLSSHGSRSKNLDVTLYDGPLCLVMVYGDGYFCIICQTAKNKNKLLSRLSVEEELWSLTA